MLRPIAERAQTHQSELLRNNAVVVRGPTGVLVIDPGVTERELACLANDIRATGQGVVAGFATHPDWDHVLWHADLGDAPRYGTMRCAARLQALLSGAGWEGEVAAALPPEIAGEVPLDLFGRIIGLSDGATRVAWDGPHVRVIEHPAHAPGHAALLVVDDGVLIAGDMLSDVLIPMPDLDGADPIGDYLIGLRALEEVADEVDVVVPGHGSPCGADEMRARIEQDRAYLEALRAGDRPDDPRIGPSAPPGWEWLSDVSEWQRQRLAGG